MMQTSANTTYIFFSNGSSVIDYILSQSYYATVFYLDNISFLAQLLLPNKSSISQASYHTTVSTIGFQLFKKQTILWR